MTKKLKQKGATVTSWICENKERLFVSKKSFHDQINPIRGGIPVIKTFIIIFFLKWVWLKILILKTKIVFPNFGPWTHGPLHGFARIKQWHAEPIIKVTF